MSQHGGDLVGDVPSMCVYAGAPGKIGLADSPHCCKCALQVAVLEFSSRLHCQQVPDEVDLLDLGLQVWGKTYRQELKTSQRLRHLGKPQHNEKLLFAKDRGPDQSTGPHPLCLEERSIFPELPRQASVLLVVAF